MIVSLIVTLLIVCVVAFFYLHMRKQVNSIVEKLNKNCPYFHSPYVDIFLNLERLFEGLFITASMEQEFMEHYKMLWLEAENVSRKLERFKLRVPTVISDFKRNCRGVHLQVVRHNDGFAQKQLKQYSRFFDTCLKYPLDSQQRRSIVSEEDNCLVVSSAGSGKTSSIVGKVKYLIEVKHVCPEKILLISYTNKAAAELTERVNIQGLRGYTFHKLAIDIVAKYTGKKPSICENTDSLFVRIFQRMIEDPTFKKNVVSYFMDYQFEETEWEQKKSERRTQLSEMKNLQLKSLFPDMDGNAVYVRSEQELRICSILSALGVKFRYEEPYEYPLADEMHAQYKPDFSIYYDCCGIEKRLYLEHFGIDEHGLVPLWFAEDKNLTYEEANERYADGITWKKTAHEKYGTRLLVTCSADFQHYDMKQKLKEMLMENGVEINEKSEDELYDMVLPKGSKQEKAFIRLIVTFVTLIKSSGRTISDVLSRIDDDQRGEFIIRNIFQPIYDRYEEELHLMGCLDFTDVILHATEICRSSSIVEYDYIIVDEFQDISVDRYNFLKALRQGDTPAKLYCVGDDWQSIYRFSGSDMVLFSQFPEFFGYTEINKIETTYRFGEPLISLSSRFIQRNKAQIEKNIRPFSNSAKTDLEFCVYDRSEYCNVIEKIVSSLPDNNSIFLLGRYSFDDYYLSFRFKSVKEDSRFFYYISGRKIEFLTVHKSKGLEADYVLILQCNKDVYGFPSRVSDDPVLNYVLTDSDQFPYGEERRLFYVAITRAKIKTFVLYDRRFPSVFVDEFLHPEKVTEESYAKHPNANKRWTKKADEYLLKLHAEGKSVRYISMKMGRSQTSIVMRLGKLKGN